MSDCSRGKRGDALLNRPEEKLTTKDMNYMKIKAVLKPPHSRRWRDCRGASVFAKRLDCGAFTAAFGERATPCRFKGSMHVSGNAHPDQWRKYCLTID
jgi:hypothetical protein